MKTTLLTNILILAGAMLVAVQLRLTLPYGNTLEPGYAAHSPLLYGLIAVSAGAAMMLTTPLKRRWALTAARWQFVDLLLGVGLTFFSVIALLPELSLLQCFYFTVTAIVLGLCAISFPARLLKHRHPDIAKNLRILWNDRYLLDMWVRNNVRARYTQAVLGILWIILLPLAQALILSLVFSQFIRMDVGDTPFVSFFLTALVPWSFFNQTLMSSTSSILGMMGLINQIYFPREILVLVKLGETIVDTTFMFAALVLINLAFGIAPTIHYVYLPILIAVTVCFTLGLALFFSYLTVFIRDVPQLLFVILQLLFYLTPIVYPTNLIPAQFRILILINPLVPLIEAFRDVLAYQRTPNWISLYYPFVMGVVLLYLGYSFFKANERRLADFV